jgi:hypothetical protein
MTNAETTTTAPALVIFGTTRTAPNKLHFLENGYPPCGKGNNKPHLRPVARGTCTVEEITCPKCARIARFAVSRRA